ncbi:hypothetical protein PPL_08333 [Heterostelium album PN500]|uniref:Uncharacterized protein n=1 Tax=Heterostelium pallidum (strain ATCC 26659 / Pp 5 / PN500) TaxID=670386 RepID=D3BHW5_HETP5|nr:hypothetical protein PPL_08333 [Heterostelium album PN500]EFA78865.1 hypothetical protein PPL_08333 [Heterostelium album PN500]|eukprot:XP_020430989.1 hypothetical protein PPL_08333 [Heterostelium album PN500]
MQYPELLLICFIPIDCCLLTFSAVVKAVDFDLEIEETIFNFGPRTPPPPPVVIKIARIRSETDANVVQVVLDSKSVLVGNPPKPARSLTIQEIFNFKDILRSPEYTKLDKVSQFVAENPPSGDTKWIVVISPEEKVIGWMASTPESGRPSFTVAFENFYQSRIPN